MAAAADIPDYDPTDPDFPGYTIMDHRRNVLRISFPGAGCCMEWLSSLLCGLCICGGCLCCPTVFPRTVSFARFRFEQGHVRMLVIVEGEDGGSSPCAPGAGRVHAYEVDKGFGSTLKAVTVVTESGLSGHRASQERTGELATAVLHLREIDSSLLVRPSKSRSALSASAGGGGLVSPYATAAVLPLSTPMANGDKAAGIAPSPAVFTTRTGVIVGLPPHPSLLAKVDYEMFTGEVEAVQRLVTLINRFIVWGHHDPSLGSPLPSPGPPTPLPLTASGGLLTAPATPLSPSPMPLTSTPGPDAEPEPHVPRFHDTEAEAEEKEQQQQQTLSPVPEEGQQRQDCAGSSSSSSSSASARLRAPPPQLEPLLPLAPSSSGDMFIGMAAERSGGGLSPGSPDVEFLSGPSLRDSVAAAATAATTTVASCSSFSSSTSTAKAEAEAGTTPVSVPGQVEERGEGKGEGEEKKEEGDDKGKEQQEEEPEVNFHSTFGDSPVPPPAAAAEGQGKQQQFPPRSDSVACAARPKTTEAALVVLELEEGRGQAS